MIFAYDAPLDEAREIDVYYDALGGKNNTYPRTLILDENGVIMYTVFGAPADVYEEGADAIYNKLANIIEQIKNQ